MSSMDKHLLAPLTSRPASQSTASGLYCCCSSMTSMVTMYLAPATVGLHQDDGSRTHWIAASPPDDSDEKTDEQGKNIHLIGAQRTQNSGFESELTFSTSGNVYTEFLCE